MARLPGSLWIFVAIIQVMLARPGAAGPCSDQTIVTRATIAAARIWADGVPLLPPYTFAVIGDSVVTCNGVPLYYRPRAVISSAPLSARDLLDRRVAAAADSALSAGVSHSAVLALACSTFAADTATVIRAEITGESEITLLWRGQDGRVSRSTTVIPPGECRAERNAPPAPPQPLEDRVAFLQRGIGHGSTYFAVGGSVQSYVPPHYPQYARELEEAARGPIVSREEWYRSGPQRGRALRFEHAVLVNTCTEWRSE